MSIDRELRAPQLTPRGEGRRVSGTGGRVQQPSKASITGPSGDPKLRDPLGHENRGQRITLNAEHRGWSETIGQPSGGTIPCDDNYVRISGGSWTVDTPPTVPTEQGSTRKRGHLILVRDTSSSATFTNVDFGSNDKDANGDPLQLSGTTTWILVYDEIDQRWDGFFGGTGNGAT